MNEGLGGVYILEMQGVFIGRFFSLSLVVLWLPNGAPYLEQFHDENGALHGPQTRWGRNGILDLNLQFEHGQELDAAGRPLPNNRGQFSTSGGC